MRIFSAGLLLGAILQLQRIASAVPGARALLPWGYTRRITGGAVVRRDTCTPDSEEFYRRILALQCDTDYKRVVEEEIEQSNCRNPLYFSDGEDDLPCSFPYDERTNVKNCSEDCYLREFYYIYCTQLGERYADISADCGQPLEGAGFCGFDEGDFCILKYNLRIPVSEACSTADDGSPETECSERCRAAVQTFRDESGCCLALLIKETDIGSGDEGASLANLFSSCRVDIPDVCTSFSPPREFLQCARDDPIGSSAAIVGATSMCITAVSLMMT
jgi:hypothetical protein